MREAVSDTSSQAISNWCKCPTFSANLTGNEFSTLGGTTAGFSFAYDTADLAPPGVGRTRVETISNVSVGGNWGRRWIPSSAIPGGSTGQPLKVGDIIRFAFWMKPSIAGFITPTIEVQDAAGTFKTGQSLAKVTVLAGVWTEVTGQFVANIGTAGYYLRSLGFTTDTVTDPTNYYPVQLNDVLKYGPCRIAVNDPLPPSGSSGDSPGWNWTGTPGLSRSVGYPWVPQPIRNLSSSPVPTAATTGLGKAWAPGTGGGSSASYIVDATGYSGGVARLDPGPAPVANTYWYLGGQVFDVSPGLPYTAALRVRQVAGTPKPFHVRLVPRNAASAGLGDIVGATVTPSALGTWVYPAAGGVLPAATARFDMQLRVPAPEVGDLWETDLCMPTPGLTYDGVLSAGGTPGWAWDGAANASTSRGLPYRLGDIAGGLVADLDGASQSFDFGLPGGTMHTGGLTMYAVGDRLDPTLGSWAGSNTGVNASGTGFSRATGFAMQHAGGGAANRVQTRLDTSAVVNQQHVGVPAAQGRRIITSRLDPAAGRFATIVDGAIPGSGGGVVTLGTGVELYRFTSAPGSVEYAPVRALLFLEAHSDTTVKRLTAWLARRYGGTIPAGY